MTATQERIEETLEEEKKAWPIADGDVTAWLSFAGEDGFLGVVVMGLSEDLPGPLHAILATKALGINPGGSVQATVFDSANFPDDVPRARLLSRRELEELGLIAVRE